MRMLFAFPARRSSSFPPPPKCSAKASPPASAANSLLGICPAQGAGAPSPAAQGLPCRGGRAHLWRKLPSAGEILLFAALLSCCAVFAAACAAVPYFLSQSSAPLFEKYGVISVFFGKEWSPEENRFGLLPMLVSTIFLALMSAAFSAPIGVLSALYIHRCCSKKTKLFLRSALSAAAAIPSVVFGLFGLSVIMPLMEKLGLNGQSALSASVLLSMMALPTLITLCLDALNGAAPEMYEAARALGAGEEYTAFTVELYCVRKDIFAACSLACTRAVAEATAILMISGNQTKLTFSPLCGVRTLAEHILLEGGYASGEHRTALMASALLLCVFSALGCLLKLPFERKR